MNVPTPQEMQDTLAEVDDDTDELEHISSPMPQSPCMQEPSPANSLEWLANCAAIFG